MLLLAPHQVSIGVLLALSLHQVEGEGGQLQTERPRHVMKKSKVARKANVSNALGHAKVWLSIFLVHTALCGSPEVLSVCVATCSMRAMATVSSMPWALRSLVSS